MRHVRSLVGQVVLGQVVLGQVVHPVVETCLHLDLESSVIGDGDGMHSP